MFVIKPALALLALGLSGWLGVTAAPPALDATVLPATTTATAVEPTSLPDYETLRLATEAAVRDRIRHDLDDPDAQVELPRIAIDRVSGRSLEAKGEGVVRMAGSPPLPIQVIGLYDLVDARVESVDYTAQAVVAEPGAVDLAVRAAIASRIGERIAADFSGQAVRFELLEVAKVGYGRHRTQLQGNGMTDFGAEGMVYTPFVATLDKHTGELLELRYDLLQEDAPATVAAF